MNHFETGNVCFIKSKTCFVFEFQYSETKVVFLQLNILMESFTKTNNKFQPTV